MKKQIRSIVSVIGIFSLCFTACSVEHKEVPLTLWYNTPADATVADQPYVGYKDDPGMAESFTLGQRFTGSYGLRGCPQRTHPLNEETVWSGSMQDCDNPEAAKHVDEIKQLLFDGKYKEATGADKPYANMYRTRYRTWKRQQSSFRLLSNDG